GEAACGKSVRHFNHRGRKHGFLCTRYQLNECIGFFNSQSDNTARTAMVGAVGYGQQAVAEEGGGHRFTLQTFVDPVIKTEGNFAHTKLFCSFVSVPPSLPPSLKLRWLKKATGARGAFGFVLKGSHAGPISCVTVLRHRLNQRPHPAKCTHRSASQPLGLARI